ncbi:Muscular LMNA-interacting protein [Fukomys damarensis]|uniref:Muscular LMNA-interacting protein n=1 Tax=Fukomys damarensis TaxID=885580 RepID=A0A091DGN4_FUKDA|nr:Muscular LMNA-interacting protein [Fukomys damarensis]
MKIHLVQLSESLSEDPQEYKKVSSGDSEAKPLIFSFVPTVRRLPTHIQLADTSKYLVKIPEEPGDKSPETINRSKSIDYVTFNLGSGQEGIQGSPLTCPSEDFETNSQGGGFKANDLQRMQQGDLFKAEYVFIVDSEGEDEVTSRKGEQGASGSTSNTVARPTTLAISSSLVSDVVPPKVWGPEPKAVSQAGTPQEMASKQKQEQPHTGASSAAALLPGPAGSGPPPASKGKRDADLGRGEEPGDIDMHPSPASAPWASPINQSATLSSPGRSYCPSPALSHLIERSRKAAPHFSGQRPSPPAAPPLPRPRSSGSAASLLRLEPLFLSPANPPIPTLPPSPAALRPRCARNTLPARMGTPESTRSSCKPPVSAPAPPISLTRTKDLVSPSALSVATGPESKPKQYKTKSSYKVFAAIPTNTLLLEQKTSTTLPRSAGRETKYANLSLPSSTASESQLTKPGVIRPVPIKSRILLKKEEEVYEPNPFSKYLDDNSGFFSEQDVTVPPKPVSLHPLYQTKLYPPAKSLLHPPTRSYADCLSPGPFSHLSSFSLHDEQNSHALLSHNTYNKELISGDRCLERPNLPKSSSNQQKSTWVGCEEREEGSVVSMTAVIHWQEDG